MLVAEEPCTNDLDLLQPLLLDLDPQPVEHDLRDVHHDDLGARRRDGHRELPRPGPDLDEHRSSGQPELVAQPDLSGGIRVLLLVVPGGVTGVEILATGAGQLVKPPATRDV